MESFEVSAEVRQEHGKGHARKIRAAGKLPGVLYGPGGDAVSLTIEPKPLVVALKSPYRRNSVIKLKLQGGDTLAVVKDLTTHPVTDALIHVDFYRVSPDRPVVTNVPFEVEGRAVGVQRGGGLRKMARTVQVKAKPLDVPAVITVNVAPLDLGAIFTVADLKLDDGVEVTLPPATKLVQVTAKELRKAKTEAEGEGDAKAAAKPAGKK